MIIFMGVAGSGKSTQGKMLADRLGLPWLSTGEFLRMLIAGEKRRGMVAGKLLDDQEIIGLVQKIFNIVNVDQEFVLDGFPRTVPQADWLLNQVKHGQLRITSVVHLLTSEEAAAARLLARGRPDDHEEALHGRFREYEDTIKPILRQFRRNGIPVYEIDGEQSIETVHQKILSTLQRSRQPA